jgi:uncharacterized protein HemY
MTTTTRAPRRAHAALTGAAALLIAASVAGAQATRDPAGAAPAASPTADGSSGAARPHLTLGRAADERGRPDEARRHYEAALAAEPGEVEASIALATLLIEANDASAAREVIARSVKRHPGDPRLLNLRIRRRAAARADGSASGAVSNDRKARAANPGDEGIALALAQVLETRGDARAAAALYDTLVAVPTASERTHLAAARQALAAGDADRARVLLRAGAARHPASAALRALADSVAGDGTPR